MLALNFQDSEQSLVATSYASSKSGESHTREKNRSDQSDVGTEINESNVSREVVSNENKESSKAFESTAINKSHETEENNGKTVEESYGCTKINEFNKSYKTNVSNQTNGSNQSEEYNEENYGGNNSKKNRCDEENHETEGSNEISQNQVTSCSRQERLADVDFSPNHVLRPFYEGQQMDDRMQLIREAIVHVRQNWHNYDYFMGKLKKFIQDLLTVRQEQFSTELDRLLSQLYSTKLNWIEEMNSSQLHTAYDRSLIQLYTSVEGYRLVFQIVYNDVLRNDAALLDQNRVLVAVFLIELFNIQLYNLCATDSTKRNFTGTVYRGMSTDLPMLQHYLRLFSLPVVQRYVSIPLALQSHSLSFDLARKFSQSVTSSSCHSIVFRIEVIAMLPDLLQEYRQRYPSVVSTICAVPISSISCFQDELEVVLRGAFFQLLSMRLINDSVDAFWLVDGVVLNANRDHISTARLGTLDGEARTFFAAAAKVTRYTYASNYAKANGLEKDGNQFVLLLEAANEELRVIRSSTLYKLSNSCEESVT